MTKEGILNKIILSNESKLEECMKKHKNLAKKQNIKLENRKKFNSISSERIEPRSLFHSFAPLLLQDPAKWLEPFHEHSGVSVSEDNKNVYIEASLPGILPEEIKLKYDRGVLYITADKKEETADKNKKFYRKAHKNFYYQVSLPCAIDETKSPNAICKNGVLKVIFFKGKIFNPKEKTILVKKG